MSKRKRPYSWQEMDDQVYLIEQGADDVASSWYMDKDKEAKRVLREMRRRIDTMLELWPVGPASEREEVVGTSTRGKSANLGNSGFSGGCMSAAIEVAA